MRPTPSRRYIYKHVVCRFVCLCAVLCCSLLYGYCFVFGAGGSVQVNTRGYPWRLTGTRLPYSTKTPTNTRGFWSHARILPGIELVFWFSIDGSKPYSTQHTHSTQHHHHQQGIAHHTSHTAHPNGYVFYVLLGVWREVETTPLAVGKHSDISSYIAFDIYRGIGKTPQPIDR